MYSPGYYPQKKRYHSSYSKKRIYGSAYQKGLTTKYQRYGRTVPLDPGYVSIPRSLPTRQSQVAQVEELRKAGLIPQCPVPQLYNYNMLNNEKVVKLPVRESIRSKIIEQIVKTDSGDYIINQYLENSAEKIIPLLQRQKVLPITPEKIKEYAQDAGFANIDFYEDYTKKPFTPESKTVVCVIS